MRITKDSWKVCKTELTLKRVLRKKYLPLIDSNECNYRIFRTFWQAKDYIMRKKALSIKAAKLELKAFRASKKKEYPYEE